MSVNKIKTASGCKAAEGWVVSEVRNKIGGLVGYSASYQHVMPAGFLTGSGFEVDHEVNVECPVYQRKSDVVRWINKRYGGGIVDYHRAVFGC